MGLRSRYRRWFQGWLARRLPPWRSLRLSQKNIFIFPSRLGLAALAFLAILLLLAVNYQNNLIFGFSFWCLGIMVVSIFHSYFQLSGLRLQVQTPKAVFAGGSLALPLLLKAGGRDRYGLSIGWPDDDWQQCDIPANGEKRLFLRYPTSRRGTLQTTRLRLETRYPLGLICAWTWLAPDWQAMVYPRPVPLSPDPASSAQEGAGVGGRLSDSDEFFGFHSYQPGESLSRAYWRSYAKGQPLLMVDYQSPESETPVLSWQPLDGLPLESRLSALAARTLELEQQGLSYRVALPELQLPDGRGESRMHQVLRYLAEYRGS